MKHNAVSPELFRGNGYKGANFGKLISTSMAWTPLRFFSWSLYEPNV